MLRGVALTGGAALAFGLAGSAALAAKLGGNVDHVDITGMVAPAPTPTKPPDPDDPSAGRAVNILVLGSDQRDGVNGEIGGVEKGMRSDTTMIMHISADRSWISIVSIPRDSLVDIPTCTMSNGTTTKAHHGMFNSAFAT